MLYDHLFKIVLGGSAKVGKSSICLQLTDHEIPDKYEPTIGVEFASITRTVKGKAIKLQIWDIASNQEFMKMQESYFRGASVFVFVFDLSRPETFHSQVEWIQRAKALQSKVPIYIIGNKKDLLDQSIIGSNRDKTDEQKAIDTIRQISGKDNYFEVSAKTGDGINAFFLKIAQDQLTLHEQSKLKTNLSDSSSKMKFNPYDPSFENKKAGLTAYLSYRNEYHQKHPILDLLRTGLSIFKGYSWEKKTKAVERLLINQELQDDNKILEDGKLGEFIARFDKS
ncbi:MAG: GTP-binding protein [Gammaproteobacteria bacterium]|nr:GTP-binding protein [Gammaproteobacteria bacterium]